MSDRLARILLAAPAVLWLVVLMVVPCALLLVNSFFVRGVYGGIDYILTTENYTRALDPLFLDIFLTSARIAATAAAIAVLIAYPVAYSIHLAAPAAQGR